MHGVLHEFLVRDVLCPQSESIRIFCMHKILLEYFVNKKLLIFDLQNILIESIHQRLDEVMETLKAFWSCASLR